MFHHKTASLCYILAQQRFNFATVNLKTEVIMWFAVLVFVCLSVEVLSYLTGGEIKMNQTGEGE